MEKDNRFSKGLITGILITMAVFVLGIAVTAVLILRAFPTLTESQNVEVSESVNNNNKINFNRVKDKLDVIQEYISQYYLWQQDMSEAEDGIYKGFVNGLGDKYSEYFDTDEWKSFEESYSGTFGGIGAVISVNDKEEAFVVSVYDDTPAQMSGVKPGDIFYMVDGEDVLGKDLDVLVNDYVRGEPGTDVVITFLRGNERKEVELTITRDIITTPTVAFEMKDNIGYMEIIQFSEATFDDFKKGIDEFTDKGAQGIILDLRDNPGGVFLSAIKMADYLLSDGSMITYTADKAGKGSQNIANDGHEVKIPIVVLVNKNSASSSEVFTGALKDNDAATIVGETSFGKGIVQNIFSLGDGTGVKLTVEHYFTPNGTDIHETGIKPDYEVGLDEQCEQYTDEKDNQYQKAVEVLKD